MRNKFSQKHYIVIARILKDTYEDSDPSYVDEWNTIKNALITEFKNDNPKFSTEKFLKACQPTQEKPYQGLGCGIPETITEKPLAQSGRKPNELLTKTIQYNRDKSGASKGKKPKLFDKKFFDALAQN